MSDITLTSEAAPTQNARRARGRRPAPREAGTDLLSLSSRVTEPEARVLAQARAILLKLCGRVGAQLTAPQAVREYLITLLAAQEREFFAMVVVDTRHRVVASEILFAGTIDGSRVYPREVVKCALRYNAAAVIFAHNHPSSGVLEPSHADELITQRQKEALALVDIRVLDHFVIGGGLALSFSERGLL
jgi:DNA repair protein RadC